MGWNADRFGNVKNDETKARFRYALKGGDSRRAIDDYCGKCFFVDYQLKTAKAMYELYDRHNPNKKSDQIIPCIDNCKQKREELNANDIELETKYEELRAQKNERKLRIDSLKTKMIEQNRIINRKKIYKKQLGSLRAHDLIAEIDRWKVLSNMKEDADKTPDEEIRQTDYTVRLYNKIKEDDVKELKTKEEPKRKLFEAFLNTFLENKGLREEVDKIDAKIDTFLSLFNSTKYFLTVDFLKDPFDKVLQAIENHITTVETTTTTPKTKVTVRNSSRLRRRKSISRRRRGSNQSSLQKSIITSRKSLSNRSSRRSLVSLSNRSSNRSKKSTKSIKRDNFME